MNNKVIIFKGNSPKKKWQSKVNEFISKWMKYNENIEVQAANKDEEIILIGYPTTSIVSNAESMIKDGYKVKVIENLCYDDSVEKHFKAIDKMFFNNIRYCRSFEFVKDDVINIVKGSIERTTGKEFSLKSTDIFNMGRYDSIDLAELICDIEDEYMTTINMNRFNKVFTVDNFYKMLEAGSLAGNIANK